MFLSHIACKVPQFQVLQDNIKERMIRYFPQKKGLLQRFYDRSGVHRRHSVLVEHAQGHAQESSLFYLPDRLGNPSTAVRAALYREHASKLFVATAQAVLQQVDPTLVTHVITVSCTGSYAPGPECDVVRELRLRPDVQRLHVGFMGCSAVFPALSMARQICQADQQAVVLIVAVELCTLHLQPDSSTGSLLGACLFADGAAGCLVSSRTPLSDNGLKFTNHSFMLPDDADKITWNIRDEGFYMHLDPQLPLLVQNNLPMVLDKLLLQRGWQAESVKWAVHPGGPKILDAVQQAQQLPPHMLDDSREILRLFGNMSSTTILFVLQRILQNETKQKNQPIVALAFGPGVSIDVMLMERS
ncbi:MAG: type III polyketide synthase [Myxococcota bacterium]